jgi:hypothetical protein
MARHAPELVAGMDRNTQAGNENVRGLRISGQLNARRASL